MYKKRLVSSLIAAIALSAGFAAQASSVSVDAPVSNTNWEVSGGLAHYGIDIGVATVNGDVLQAGFAYAVRNPEGHFSVVPELTLGKGVNGDTINSVDIDVDTVLQVGTRLALHPTEKFDIYLNPTYRKVTLDMSEDYDSVGLSSKWTFGIGVGVGVNVSDNVNLALSFDRAKLELEGEKFDTDVVSAKVNYRF